MIAVGVDTHKERHYAAALDALGQLLGELTFAATAAGYLELQRWAESLSDAQQLTFGIEDAGSWGADFANTCKEPVMPLSRSSVHVDESAEGGSLTVSTRSQQPNACLPARTSQPRAAAAFSQRCVPY
jgi:hypothetical protein